MAKDETSKRQGCLRALLWITLAGLLLQVVFQIMVRDFVFLKALVRLLIGWASFVKLNFLLLSPRPTYLILAFVMSIAAVIGLHLLALGWRARIWPTLPRWRQHWSVAVFAGLLACSLAAIAFAGVAHQIAWLKGESFFNSSRFRDKGYSAALDIVSQIQLHASRERNDGYYPDGMNEVSWERGGISALFPDRLLLYQASETAIPEPWIYHGKGLKTDSPEGLLLLSAPRSVEGKRWVVLTRADAKMVSDVEYQAHLKRLKAFIVDAAP